MIYVMVVVTVAGRNPAFHAIVRRCQKLRLGKTRAIVVHVVAPRMTAVLAFRRILRTMLQYHAYAAAMVVMRNNGKHQ